METAQGGSSRRAAPPEGLARLFFELANEAEVEGVMKLYEHDALASEEKSRLIPQRA